MCENKIIVHVVHCIVISIDINSNTIEKLFSEPNSCHSKFIYNVKTHLMIKNVGIFFWTNMIKLIKTLIYDFSTQDLEGTRQRILSENGLELEDMAPPLPQDDFIEPEYKFSKFASMYFTANATHTYIRRALREPVLNLKNDGDKLVCSSDETCLVGYHSGM